MAFNFLCYMLIYFFIKLSFFFALNFSTAGQQYFFSDYYWDQASHPGQQYFPSRSKQNKSAPTTSSHKQKHVRFPIVKQSLDRDTAGGSERNPASGWLHRYHHHYRRSWPRSSLCCNCASITWWSAASSLDSSKRKEVHAPGDGERASCRSNIFKAAPRRAQAQAQARSDLTSLCNRLYGRHWPRN